MKRLSTFLFALLLTTIGFAQIKCPLGGQSAHGQWSYGWTQTMVATADLHFSQQWGEFNLATTGLTEGATYKLTVAEANEKINLRFNTGGDPISQPVNATEITGTIPAGITAIELQATEANLDLQVVSFTINDVQTEYSVNWGTLFFAGYYTSTQQWAEIMVNGVEKYDQQVITVKTNEIIPEGIQLKVLYSDDTEDWPVLTAGVKTASVDLTKPVKQVSIQETKKDVPSILDIVSVTTFPYKDVTISPASGSITDALTEALGDYNARNVTINLAENGAYTISKSIIAGGNVAINGADGATIDASGLTTGAFINYASVIGEKVKKADGVTPSDYTQVGNVEVKNVKITGLAKSFINNSAGKVLFSKVTVDNVNVEVSGSNAIFALGNGYPADLKIMNSTLWAKGEGHKGFLFQAHGKAPDINADYKTSWSIDKSTLYQIGVGKKLNNTNTFKGKNYLVMSLTNSILVNTGTSTGSEVNGWLFGQNSTTPTITYANNTYWAAGAVVSGWTDATKAGSDQTNTSLTTDPKFKDAENGDFAIPTNSHQAKNGTGDPRWGTYDAGYLITVINVEGLTITPEVTYAAEGEKAYCTYVLAEDYKLERPDFVDDDNNPIEFVDGTTCGLEEVGGVEKMWIIMPAKNVTIKAKVTAMPKFYIIGEMNGWDRTAMTKMTYNDESGRYEYDYAPTTTAYFAFADYQQTAEEAAADGSWTTFNSTYRYSLGAGNVDATIGEIKSLTKGVDGTIVLQPGTYKISVEKDFNAVTITGEVAPPPTEDTYVVAGAPASLFGTEWSGTAEANKMTKNTETGLYELKFTGVAFTAATTIEYKIVKNSSIWIPDGMGNNQTVSIPAAGTYDITFTFNPEGSVITGVATVATGIGIINVDGVNDIFSDGAPVYNLKGERIFKGYKGIAVKNGKKVVIK